MALHTKIILGLILGLILGIISVFAGIGEFISDWVSPFGTIFAEPSERPLQLILLVVIVGDTKDGGAKISIESNFKQPLASVIEAT